MKAELKELGGVYSIEMWFWNGMSNQARFSGKMAEVALYTRALDAGEMGRHYRAGKSR